MTQRMRATLVMTSVLIVALSAALSAEEQSAGTIVLDTCGFWRLHYTHKPPVVRTAAGLKPVIYKADLWINRETASPPAGWEKPDFDDRTWRRLPGTPFPVQRLSWLKLPDLNFGFSSIDMSSPYMAHMAMRGKFRVNDPAKVKGLVLSLAYRGGVVVSLNGKEVARGDMPDGEITVDRETGRRAPGRIQTDQAFPRPCRDA